MEVVGLFLVWVLPTITAQGPTVEVTCPAVMDLGDKNDIVCTINITAISSAGCVSPPSTVVFNSINTAQTQLCTTSYTTSDCNQQLDRNQCGCTSKSVSGDLKIFTLKLVGDRASQLGSNITCSVCLSNKITFVSTHCTNLTKFAETCASSNPCNHGTCDRDGTELKCNCDPLYTGYNCTKLHTGHVLALALCLGIFCLIVAVIATVWGVKKCKKNKQCCYKK